jgi:hypothetical protein
LIWRIFYDPLLSKINDDTSLGYEFKDYWPTNLAPNTNEFRLRVGGVAFTDDTTWIVNNKVEMMWIIDISSSFYNLNNIKINEGKSKLLVWNSKLPKNHLQITIGSDNDTIKANLPTQCSRYLGVYIRSKASNSHIEKLI